MLIRKSRLHCVHFQMAQHTCHALPSPYEPWAFSTYRAYTSNALGWSSSQFRVCILHHGLWWWRHNVQSQSACACHKLHTVWSPPKRVILQLYLMWSDRQISHLHNSTREMRNGNLRWDRNELQLKRACDAINAIGQSNNYTICT